jgi:hypothetical protein
VESIASTGDKRIYAVRKVLRTLEDVTGKGYREAIEDIANGRMDTHETIRASLPRCRRRILRPRPRCGIQ